MHLCAMVRFRTSSCRLPVPEEIEKSLNRWLPQTNTRPGKVKVAPTLGVFRVLAEAALLEGTGTSNIETSEGRQIH